MKREFLMLAQEFKPDKHFIGGWYASEKADGIRCFWDGGISRGKLAGEIPWANTEKHARYLTPPRATGLWTRYGQPIQAPDWWLDALPLIPLDGELTMGRGTWQATTSCVKCLEPDYRWQNVKYLIFESPPLESVFSDGRINNMNFKKTLSGIQIPGIGYPVQAFYKTLARLKELEQNEVCEIMQQDQLPQGTQNAIAWLEQRLSEIELAGGEGLMLRNPISAWSPERTHNLLKVKSRHDMEGTVVGYKWAKGTDLERSISGNQTDKLLGLMGSVRVRLDSGIEFDLSGFTESERQMRVLDRACPFPYIVAREYGAKHPGETVPDIMYTNPNFPIGSRISFKYRELSNDGFPKEARFLRKEL